MRNVSFIVGRQPSSIHNEIPIAVNDTKNNVSRNHCRIFYVNGDFYIEDLNSRNGTFVNGVRINGRTRITRNDHIRLGHYYNFSLNHPVINSRLGLGQRQGQQEQEAPRTVFGIPMPDINAENIPVKDAILSKTESLIGIGSFFSIFLFLLLSIPFFIDSVAGAVIIMLGFFTYYITSLILLASYYKKRNIPIISMVLYSIIGLSIFMLIAIVISIINEDKYHLYYGYYRSSNTLIFLVILLQFFYAIANMWLGFLMLTKDIKQNLALKITAFSNSFLNFMLFIITLIEVSVLISKSMVDPLFPGILFAISLLLTIIIFISIFAFYILQYELNKRKENNLQ